LAALNKMQVFLNSPPRQLVPPLQNPPPKRDQPKPPEPAKKKPPAPTKFEKPQTPMKDDSGEANGTGTANRSTDGKRPMLANAGLEQADLMKEAERFIEDAMLPASKRQQTTRLPPLKPTAINPPIRRMIIPAWDRYR
jgi:hypothetical protein